MGGEVPGRVDASGDAIAVGADEEGGPDAAEPSPLILNWFRAKGEVSSGAVEGLNNKVKLVTRKSNGLRTARVAKLALLHNLGRLPEPKHTHRFC
jgi:hypothetical protein